MRHFVFLFVFALFLSACGRGSYQSEQSAESVGESIDSIFGQLFGADEPGAVVIVMRGDSVVYDRGFGLARLDTVVPMTDSTMFNICSVSKQFAAVALLKLAEEGRLSLDDAVSKYYPEFKGEFFKRITLRHLMSHTSGIPDARPRTEAEWLSYRRTHDSKFQTVGEFKLFCEEDESCRYMIDLDSLAFEPGTAYEYQNPTFQLMSGIVEKVTGQRFDDWMRDSIFLPASMVEATYFEPGKYIARMAHGYEPAHDGDASRWAESDYGEASFFGTKADGGLYTTPREFLNWYRAINADAVITRQSREAAHTGYIDTDIPFTSYGYGWFVENRPDRPEKIYHTGDNGGFLIFEGWYPSADLFYLIFANRPDWDREATVEKMDSVFERAGWLKAGR